MYSKGRIFGIALAISVAWHFAWICGPKVVLVPDNIKVKEYPVIAFLGPILAETAFERRPAILTDFVALAANIDLVSDEPKLGLGSSASRTRDVVGLSAEDKKLAKREVSGSDKWVPRDLAPRFKIAPKPLPFKIEGPVSPRAIVNIPPLPPLPKWADEGEFEFVVKLKFLVSPEGVVREVEPVVASGYPEIDLLGIRYLNKLRFQTLSPGPEGPDQWGVISLKLK